MLATFQCTLLHGNTLIASAAQFAKAPKGMTCNSKIALLRWTAEQSQKAQPESAFSWVCHYGISAKEQQKLHKYFLTCTFLTFPGMQGKSPAMASGLECLCMWTVSSNTSYKFSRLQVKMLLHSFCKLPRTLPHAWGGPSLTSLLTEPMVAPCSQNWDSSLWWTECQWQQSPWCEIPQV